MTMLTQCVCSEWKVFLNKWQYHWKTQRSKNQRTLNQRFEWFLPDDVKVGFENWRCNSEDICTLLRRCGNILIKWEGLVFVIIYLKRNKIKKNRYSILIYKIYIMYIEWIFQILHLDILDFIVLWFLNNLESLINSHKNVGEI